VLAACFCWPYFLACYVGWLDMLATLLYRLAFDAAKKFWLDLLAE
jgi:hypothetical protein